MWGRGKAAFFGVRPKALPFRGGKCRCAASEASDSSIGTGLLVIGSAAPYDLRTMESAFSSTRAAVVRRLRAAASEDEVVRLVREFIAEWRPEELSRIPHACRPAKIRDAEDVADCAFALTRSRMDASEADALLVEMETFFAMACGRLSALEGAGRGKGRSDSESESA